MLVAAAVGVSVSVGQYLPTLLIGGGRVATLTTERSRLLGGDRRAIGVFGCRRRWPQRPSRWPRCCPAIWRNRRGCMSDRCISIRLKSVTVIVGWWRWIAM